MGVPSPCSTSAAGSRQHAAVGEGDAAAHTVRHKRRRVQAQGPVGLGGCDALGAFAVLDGRVEGPVLDRGIIGV